VDAFEKPAVIKPTVVHDEGQGLEDVDALTSTIGSKLEANVSLNATGDRPTVGAPKSTAALVDVVEKLVGFLATVTQDEGKELFEQAKQSRKGLADQSKGRAWTVVTRYPSKRISPGLKNQIIASKNTDVSNSFNALINDHEQVRKEDGKILQIVMHTQKLDKTTL
ncbi:hypothetical protein A4A49_58853, partial [Nicotiana attenuata]